VPVPFEFPLSFPRYNCLAQLSDRFNFIPSWRPPFVLEDGPADRCHLNGLAVVDGKPAYVTALGATNEPGAWRTDRVAGGVLVSVADGSIRLSGLCMPHSPRWHEGQLYLLNSGRGQLLRVDPNKGSFDIICTLRAYVRGLCFVAHYALGGMCQVREQHLFSGLPIQEQFQELKCGAAVSSTWDTLPACHFGNEMRPLNAE
jgi:uncharacterized protein (TIGR03032 family)